LDDDFPYDEEAGQIGGYGDVAGGDVPDSDGGFLPVQFGGLGGLAGRAGAMIGPAARAAGAAAGRVGRILMRSGKTISTTKAYQLMRTWGPEIAATALGMSIADLIAILADSGAMTRRRRRRGISSRDIRTTSRVVRFVNRMQHQIGCVSRPARHLPAHRHTVTSRR